VRISVVDFEFPEPDRSSGGHRLFELVAMLVGMGHEVSFLSFDYWRQWNRQDAKYKAALETMGVVCAREPRDGVGEVASGFFQDAMPDVAVLCHYYVFNVMAPYIRMTAPSCRLILDTVDIHHVREARMLAVKGFGEPEKVKIGETAAIAAADRVWAITEVDAAVAREWAKDVAVVPNVHPSEPEGKSFEERDGIVFVGNYAHKPNWDAVWWFSNHIMPIVEQTGCRLPFKAVGAELDPKGYKDWRNVRCEGWVKDLAAYLRGSRVGVAPLRFGSGMKGKIGDYLANGLPCVTTSIGAEGMGLENGKEVFIADEREDFANAVAFLGSDKRLWGRMSVAGMEWAARFSPERVSGILAKAIRL
jgi:glycosyltransferase involved in cell wall biosynthesis